MDTKKMTKFAVLISLLAPVVFILSFSTAEAVPKHHHAFEGYGTRGCQRCHLRHHDPSVTNNYYIKSTITIPSDGTDKTVVLTDVPTDFADGDITYDGVCEVCHTATLFHKNDGTGGSHRAAEDCRRCHSHENRMSHCSSDCHTSEPYYTRPTDAGHQSHVTHLQDSRGPTGQPFGTTCTCSTCHYDTDLGVPGIENIRFQDAVTLTSTTSCDDCHSPGGGFDGVDDTTMGAKTNWPAGVYEDNVNYEITSLITGKEKWCAGCHDNDPSIVDGKTAPDICGDNSTYGYYLGAHGNGTYGVSRQGVGYDQGECLHCHNASTAGIDHGGELFDQTTDFCFQCHKGTGSVQVGGITNNTYSTNFGGGTATFTTIYDAFNPATGATPSSHNLSDVLTHAVNNIGFSGETNACIVCHDKHLAQQNYPVTLSGLGGVKTAIRRPLDYASSPTNLWGDESGGNELMSEYTAKYQAPYYVGGSNFEPANNGTADGSNLPNFKVFCNNCHSTQNVYSTERSGNLRKIAWANEQHGKSHNGGTMGGASIAPYTDHGYNYVLACTDCHEPHGSENEWLLRTCVNGNEVSIAAPNQWLGFCSACHTINQHTAPWGPATDCYNNGLCHHHGAGGGMF